MTDQADGLISSTDYIVNQLSIVTSDGVTVDLTDLFIELDLYEDIFTPTMTGSVRLGEARDLISTLRLHGNEYLVIDIDKPTLNKPIKKTFRIYKISDRDFGTSVVQNYTIYFCSEEMFLSTQFLISKSYKGLRVDQIINDILVNKLKTDPKKLSFFEQTSGSVDLIVPRMQPFEAIGWLLPKAYNNNKQLFFFFENRDGYNLVSYETLISLPSYKTFSRDVKLDQDPVKNINSFNYVKVIEDFNIMKAMRYGAFSSTINTYDVINRKFNSYNANMKNLANTATLNSSLPANDFKNRLGFTFFTTNENQLKYTMTTDSDPQRNPAVFKNWQPQTAARLAQINMFKLVMTVPGDILMKAGMVVDVLLPKMIPQEKTVANDDVRSGRYLVSSVHHKFIGTISTTIVELLSDSIGVALPQPLTTSPTLQALIKA